MPRQVTFLSEAYFTKLVTNAARARMRSGVASQVSQNERIRVGVKRIPSNAEVAAVDAERAKRPLHHYVFCTHNKLYWNTCMKCGRDRALAQRNAELILHSVEKMSKP